MKDLGGAVVVIPAHNEAALLHGCLRSVMTAASCLPAPVWVVVVLDACDDGSADLAGSFGTDVHFIEVDAKNVGAARAAGFRYARSVAAVDVSRCWYATTDADCRVDPDWLVRQTTADADLVLGVVRIPVWRHHSPLVAQRYLRGYHADGLNHDHVHGANLGCRADAYWRVGGFAALATGEDVDLVARFERGGYRIHRDAALSVATSDRTNSRAPDGFAQHLNELSQTVSAQATEHP
ncbi:MAG: glycosyltransferase [Mycobacteriaceae bacterium]|nr:glycosyltransferase [Mycobacteriaceae bacterium]